MVAEKNVKKQLKTWKGQWHIELITCQDINDDF
jgi:hypothetical protein